MVTEVVVKEDDVVTGTTGSVGVTEAIEFDAATKRSSASSKSGV